MRANFCAASSSAAWKGNSSRGENKSPSENRLKRVVESTKVVGLTRCLVSGAGLPDVRDVNSKKRDAWRGTRI